MFCNAFNRVHKSFNNPTVTYLLVLFTITNRKNQIIYALYPQILVKSASLNFKSGTEELPCVNYQLDRSVPIVAAIYVLFSNILLTNLVIAEFRYVLHISNKKNIPFHHVFNCTFALLQNYYMFSSYRGHMSK